MWLTSNITVLKGVTIGKGSMITSYSTVNKDMPEHSLISADAVAKPIRDGVNWSRDRCPRPLELEENTNGGGGGYETYVSLRLADGIFLQVTRFNMTTSYLRFLFRKTAVLNLLTESEIRKEQAV